MTREEKRKKYREENKEKIKKYNKQYYANLIKTNSTEINERRKKYYQENKENIKNTTKKWKENNLEKYSKRVDDWHYENKLKVKQHQIKYIRTIGGRFSSGKYQARKKKLEWTISKKEFYKLATLECDYCNGYFGKIITGSGLDRMDNNRGYTIDNVVPCCWFCNRFKSDKLSYLETKELIKILMQLRNMSSSSTTS